MSPFGFRNTLFTAAVIGVIPPTAMAQRMVDGTTVTSTAMPPVRITLDTAFTYVGGQTIMLSATTRAEQHLFVEADDDRIRRLYWLQFEGKVGNGGRPYNYSRDSTIPFGGQRFHVNYRFYPTDGFGGRAGSDGDRAHQLLRHEGYRLGSDLIRVRLVWLLDDPPMNELMIIYLEDLADHGLTVAHLERDPERWRALQQGLLRRALGGLALAADP